MGAPTGPSSSRQKTSAHEAAPQVDRDRLVGALLGLAVGDALGAPMEFAPRDTLPAVTGMRGGGRFGLEAGQWTDDTSMALCLARSLIETGTFDLRDQAERFLRWRDEGYLTSTGRCFGIGHQTLWSLSDFARTRRVLREPSTRWTAGNGSLMRLAPVAIVFAADLDLADTLCRASSMTTHPLPVCVEACGAWGRLIALAAQGTSRETLHFHAKALASQVHDGELATVLSGSYLHLSREEVRSSGYVIHTMEAALWALAHTSTFADGALLAVNLGHDADTVGSVYGQLAGAFYGLNAIPQDWVRQLADGEMVLETAHELAGLSGTVSVSEETAGLLDATG
ncbi:ADP-ribosylglycohydrolase family protein [Actinomyces urogenitalis]|uniref:ADP-ribosylglycohydrolase family protein n=1 Tax=Actinomyces urogenitalis TaxID=103621 RepID=UPI00242A3551|nr:ADP-ribosylglycohydrolase family protein [Actinomyces urogenitalis]MCI7457459.1 ADP-ribosylglycohydrolase family protein [Actinomyces urogenitalis]